MEITSTEFVISNTDVKKCPAGIFPEYAFIGRSNVGKSSLINMLTSRKGLAMTSSTPGKTMLINHFLINKNWYLVDLPGYGYARRGQKGKDQIRTIIEDYILEREQMTNLFVLIDSRLEPQKIDLEFMEWLGENGIPFSIIFTKADKLKGGRLKMNINAYLRELGKQWEELPPHFVSSSEDRTGRVDILNYIENINKDLNKLVEERLDHTRQMEGLLLSIARGYASAAIEKYGLPELENWYGVSIFMTERTADTDEVQVQKKLMKDRILAVIPETIVLDSGNRSLFAVIPFQTKEQLNYFVSVSEQVCSEEKHWALAVSKEKKGIYGLSEAWKETESAMRYLLADTKKNIIFYKNIETLHRFQHYLLHFSNHHY